MAWNRRHLLVIPSVGWARGPTYVDEKMHRSGNHPLSNRRPFLVIPSEERNLQFYGRLVEMFFDGAKPTCPACPGAPWGVPWRDLQFT